MNALVYLLGARALDVARERDDIPPRTAEELPGPLATTDATAAAWRRWRERDGLTAHSTNGSRRALPRTTALRPTTG
jgi:hypothetical protein